jgi:hypothetical protein
MKYCPRCKIEKSLDCFSPDNTRKDRKAGHCRSCNTKAKADWRLRNPEKNKQSSHNWYLENKEYSAAQRKRWRKDNPKRSRDYYRERRHTNIQVKLAWLLRSRLGMALKQNIKNGSAVKDLGCSLDFLKQYLESKFLPGMTWKNHGFGNDKWHIDHIVPLDLFDLTKRPQLLKACHYMNLQPLWQRDNLSKGSKIF